MRILVVEDEKKVASFIKRGLEEEQYEVQTATDGEEGLSLALEKTFDLIVLDWNLPKKDGREVLAEIKTSEELKRIPVIVLTSSTSAEDVNNAYGEHANCYVAKPVDLDEFARIIKIIEEFWFKTVILPSRSRT